MANCPEGPVWNRRISRAVASSNIDDSYHIDPDLSIIKCYYSNHSMLNAASWMTPRLLQPRRTDAAEARRHPANAATMDVKPRQA